jgi:hypothetical protein
MKVQENLRSLSKFVLHTLIHTFPPEIQLPHTVVMLAECDRKPSGFCIGGFTNAPLTFSPNLAISQSSHDVNYLS